MYGCLIDIDARSVKSDRPTQQVRQFRRPAGGVHNASSTFNAYDRIEAIAHAHGFNKFKGGLYLSETATRDDALALIDDITAQCPWFPRAVTQAHLMEFTGHENVIDRVRDHLK